MKKQMFILLASVLTLTTTSCSKSGDSTGSTEFLTPKVELIEMSFNVDEDSSLTKDLKTVSSSGTEYKIVKNPKHGIVSIDKKGEFTYVPEVNFTGEDEFTYETIINKKVMTNTINLKVLAKNDSPVLAQPTSSLEIDEDNVLTGNLTATDVDSLTLNYIIASQPSHGALTVLPLGSYVYTPALNYHGADSFSLRVSDGNSDSATVNFPINVRSVNDVPVASGLNLGLDAGQSVNPKLVASDVDGDTLTFSIVSQPTKGVASLNSTTGILSYTASLGTSGEDTLTFKVSDGIANSEVKTVRFVINAVNTAPISNPATLSLDEDTVLSNTLVSTDVNKDALTIEVVEQPQHGVLVVNPDFTFTYTPALNYHGLDSFKFRSNDGEFDSNLALVALTINPVNDIPVSQNYDVIVQEDTVLNSSVVATDVDGDALTYSAVSQPANGTLTFNPNGSFSYTPNSDYSGTDLFTFKANDGTADSVVHSVNITITSVNDSPVISPLSFSTPEDTAFNGIFSATDSDSTALTYTVVSSPNKGTLSLNSNGSFTYTPSLNSSGFDQFTVKVSDGTNEVLTTASVSIIASNDAPTSSNGSLTLNEDSVGNGTLLAEDIDADALTYSVVSQPLKGTVSVNQNTGAYVYAPNSNVNGTDSFTFRVSDGTSLSNVSTVSLNITPVNDAPTSSNGILSLNEDTIGNGTLTATDIDGNALTYAVVSQPSKGTVVINSTTGNYIYTPNANSNGTDSFTFKANDGSLDSNASTITITINAVNDLPNSIDGTLTLNEDAVGTGTANSSDQDSNTLIYSIVNQPTKGVVSIDSNTGAYTYTPSLNQNGSDSFTFRTNDGTGFSNLATISVSITPINDAPTSSNGVLTLNEDSFGSGTLTASDVDGDSLTYSVVSQPSKGTITLNPSTGSYTYTPNFNANGSDSFTFKANDSIIDSNISTVSISITNVNDTPVSFSNTLAAVEDTVKSGTLTATDTDADALTYSIVSQGTKGVVAITNSTTGAFTYTPNLNQNGSDSFTFKVNDGISDSNVATITVSISPVNDAPVSSGRTLAVNEDSNVDSTFIASDVDGDTLTYSVVAQPSKGTLSVNPSSNFFTYTPNANANGTDTFTFKVNDGSLDSNVSTITVNIAPVNDAPLASNLSFTTNEDTTKTGTLTATDTDGDALTYSIVSQGTKGVATITNATIGVFSYVPNANENGVDTFTIRVYDGTTYSNAGTITMTITPVNDLPLASNSSFTTNEDTTKTGTLTASDVDGDVLNYMILAQGTKGVATITNATTGAFSYVPNANANGTDTFTFRVYDGTTYSNAGTITMTITSVNDAPLASNLSFTTNEDTTKTGTVLSTDADGDTLTYMILAQGTKGVATITNSATGAFSYVPNANANGTDTFTFRVHDGTTYSDAGTITMTITPVNDIPVWTSSTSITLSAVGTAPVNTTLTATDVDGDSITYSMLACTGGTCNINSTTGVFTFTPNGTAGTYMVSARCFDGTVYCSSNTNITINVASANQAPLAVNSSEKLLVRTGSTTFTLNASDADSNPLTYEIISQPANGTLSAVSGNSITYTLGAWTSCASEGQSCAMTGTKLVKYGSATKYVIYKMTGNFMCDNETLGDPDVGSGKTCSTLPISDSFVFRANDGTANSNMATVSISYEDWFDKAWSKRKKLVFNNNGAGDVYDAPVLVKLDSSRVDYSQMQANGEDLRFVDEAGNILSYEIEKWNPAGISYVWVKTTIGGMEPKSHFIWMYYGNMISSAGQNKADVWSNGYVSVWHFATTTGDVLDSKGSNHGTAQSLASRNYSGPLGNAYSNSNAAGCIEIAHNSSQALTSEFTIEALSRGTSVAGFSDLVQKDVYYDGNWYWAYSLEFSDGYMGMSIVDNSYKSSNYYTEAKHNTLNTWKYQAVSFKDSSNTARAYSNGVMVAQDTDAKRSMYSGANWNALSLMGDCSGSGFKGQADEIRLSNVERNADWIKVQQLSMTDSLMMYGQEQDSSAPNMGVAYAINIGSNNDDGNIILGLNSWNMSGENGSGVNYMGEENNQSSYGYYRFKMNHDVPSMGVSNVKLKVMGSDATNIGLWNSSTRYLKVSMQKSTNSGQITAFNQYPGGAGGITDSTTKVDWNASSLNWNGTGWNETPNLSTMFNEVRSSYNLQKNNYVQLWVNRGATFNCGASSLCQAGGSDYSSSNGMTSAQLLIEYW